MRMTEKEFDSKMSELIKQKRYNEIPKLEKAYDEQFWKYEYFEKTIKEKIEYWSMSFNVEMRRSGEQGYQELSIFSKKSFSYWLSKEPDLEKMLPDVLKQINLSKEKVYPLLGLNL
jgi:hypothetical protein